jgi:hypothetical protein
MNPISGVLSGHFTGPTGEGLVIGGTISGPGAPISYAAGMKRCPSASPC